MEGTDEKAPAWEQLKENVLPLRQGRRAQTLNEALQADDEFRDRFEREKRYFDKL